MEHLAQQVEVMFLQVLAEIVRWHPHIDLALGLVEGDRADVREPGIIGLRLHVMSYQLQTLAPTGIYILQGFHSFWLRGIDF